MVLRLPKRQVLFLVMIFVFSFATFYWSFYELGFPSTLFVLIVIIAASFGFTFLMYNLIFKLSRTLYAGQFNHDKEDVPKIEDIYETEPPKDEREELREIMDRGTP